MTALLSPLSLGLLLLLYLVSMYFLVRIFVRTLKIILQHPGNGLEFYRRLVLITISATMIDATYTTFVYLTYWEHLSSTYIMYGMLPVFVKSLILVCVYGFYMVQLGHTPAWLSCTYWQQKLKSWVC